MRSREMAITRNASEANEIMIFGLDLERGDEVGHQQSELRKDDHVVGAASAPRWDRPETVSFKVPPPSANTSSSSSWPR